MSRAVKVLLTLNLLALSTILARPFVVVPLSAAQSSANVQDKDNQELVRLMDEDQADRLPSCRQVIDWKVVGPRDDARLKVSRSFIHRINYEAVMITSMPLSFCGTGVGAITGTFSERSRNGAFEI